MTEPRILAIDTSCDETAVAVTQGTTVLSNVIASQVELHKKYGGVFPTVAKQAHKENLPKVVLEALKRAQLTWDDIQYIAVTQGPGLAPALEVGITYAKELAQTHSKPLIPVNHIEGHLVSVLARPVSKKEKNSPATSTPTPTYPVLAIIVSGGHTEFMLVEKPGTYAKLGKTIDDAAGEALDKIGRILGLGYPAGAILEEFAKKSTSPISPAFKLPLPMTTSNDANMSFAGLKTASRNLIEKLESEKPLTKEVVYDLAASVQYAIFRHITHKLTKVLQDHPEIKEIWIGGGVAANMNLRKTIRTTVQSQNKKILIRTPYSKKLCGDNAAMIGIAASWHLDTQSLDFERQPNLSL